MQLFYRELRNLFDEIEKDMAERGNSYRVTYAKETMKKLVDGYFEEAKWLHQKYVPTIDEYMNVALVTSGYKMLRTVSYLGMDEIATKEAFDWILDGPAIIEASEYIARVMDDIRSHKFEQERGHAPSSVECYIKQYGVTEKEATRELWKQVVHAWKEVNVGCLRPTEVPMPLVTRILNLARVIDVIYKGEDGYTHVGKTMKENVASLLIDPVVV